MPLNRYQVRNEYSLADPHLYKVADKDDPEALLEGVAMAGLVGVLRQLGDLAEFAAEIFHDLHEEVMATAARGHSLIVRVQQLEAEFPSVEKTLLLQTSHTAFLYNSGIDWHPNFRMNQNLVTQGDLPRFVLDSYEECRGPPRLFLLDKFDVAGAGACLKRYTDPSFFKEAPSSTGRKSEGQREKRIRKAKKRGPRWMNGDTPETFPSSHAKLHQLFLEENIETGSISKDPEHRVQLKNRQFSGSVLDQDKGKSYMEKILNIDSLQQKTVDEKCVDSLPLTWPSENCCEFGRDIVEIDNVSPLKESIQTEKNASSLFDNMDMMVTPSMDDFSEGKLNEIIASEAVGVTGFDYESDACKISSTISKIVIGEEYADGESQSEMGVDEVQNSDGFTSEIDNYLDALATIDSEVETDSECKMNPHYSNLKPFLVDSDTSEGKRKLQSCDAQSSANLITLEDDTSFFKGQDSSSCSVSVDTLAETALELDAAVMAVPSIPASNPDLDKTSVDHHSMIDEIPGTEPEKHASSSTISVEADEKSRSVLTDQDTLILPVDLESGLLKNCLLSGDLDEMYTDSAKPGLTSRISDQGDANESAIWSCNGKAADGAERTDSGHCSPGELSMRDTAGGNSCVHSESLPDLSNTRDCLVDLVPKESVRPNSVGSSSSAEKHSHDIARAKVDVFSDTGLPLINPLISDFKHPEIVGPIYLASNVDFCIPSTEELSANQSCASSFTQWFNFQEQISETMNSGHAPQPDSAARALPSFLEDPIIKEVFADVQSKKEASSSSSFSKTVDTDETNIAGVVSSGDEETSGNSVLTGNLTPVLDFSETQEHRQKHSKEKNGAPLSELHLAEASKQYLGSEDEGYAVDVATFARDVYHDGTPIYSNPAVTVVDLDKAATQVIQADATNDHGHDDNHDNETLPPDEFTFDMPSKLPSNSNYVLPAENNLDLHHDVAKVDIIAIGSDGSRQDDENFHYDNAIPLPSPSSLNPEKIQEQSVSVDENHQNEEEMFLRRTVELEAQKRADSLQDTPENLDSNMCSLSSGASATLALVTGSLAENVQNNVESVVEAPSTSENSALIVELMIPTMKGLDHLESECKVKPSCADELSSQSLQHSKQIQTPHNFHDLPSVLQLPPQPAAHTVECSSQPIIKPTLASTGHESHNGNNQATQGVENSGQPVYPRGFPALGMLPAEPQMSLDSPPLPPLPPMQWRLGRFQNSSAASERQMIQHTLGPVQPIPATVSEISSQDEKYGIREDNLSFNTPSISIRSQNGIQTLADGYVTQQMLQNTSVAPGRQVLQHTTDPVQPMLNTVLEVPSHINMIETRGEDNLSFTTPTSIRSHIGTQDPTDDYVGFSENNMDGIGREDNPLSITTSTNYPNGNQISEASHQPYGNPHESTALVEGHSSGLSPVVMEEKVDAEVCVQDEQLEHISQYKDEEGVNSVVQFLPPSKIQPSPDLVAPEAGRTCSSTYDGIQTNADENASETLQKKPPRPRNPLIDEVVAIDKSKLRKVERVKSAIELKPGGDSLLEQMQLKKVERVKPPVEGNAEDGESSLEHVQLRKVGERVIPEAEQKPEETESPWVLLRKVNKRAHPLLGSKSMDRNSLLEQIRTKSFNLKPAVLARPNIQVPSIQGPRTNLKVAAILEKASNIRQAMAGSDEEDGDTWSDC